MAPLVVSKVDDTKQSPTLGTTNDFLQHDENLAIMRSRIINGVLVDLNETADKINVNIRPTRQDRQELSKKSSQNYLIRSKL